MTPCSAAAVAAASTGVSVVIPVYRGGAAFARCLDAVAALDPPPLETIVVVDGEDNGESALASRRGAQVLRTARRGGPATARNLGARHARGDVLLFLDADVTAHPPVVGQVQRYLRAHPEVTAVIGSYDDAPTEPNFLSQYKNLAHHFTHQRARLEGETFWGACGAIRRDAYLRVRGFDEGYPQPSIEDIELGYRLRAAGERIHVRDDIQVTHLKRWDVRSLLVTDFSRRALPWSALILRTGRMADDLNTTVAARAKVALSCALVAALAASPRWRGARGVAVTCGAGVVALDLPLLRFLSRHRGSGFAARAAGWQAFSHVYSGVAFALALAQHARAVRGVLRTDAAPGRDLEATP